MTNRFIGPWLCGGALLLAVLTPAIAPAAPVTFACSPTEMKGNASSQTGSTNLVTFVNIPEGHVGFVQGGTVASCVVVSFSAQMPQNGQPTVIRALLNNVTAGLPSEVIFYPAGANSTQAFTFIFPNVSPGTNDIRMQFRSPNAPNFSNIYSHNTVVQFAP